MWAGIAVCATAAALAGPSAALKVMCSPNSSGSQTCQGTDSFTYDGENNAGCPPAGTVETVTINEDVASDATNVTGTWGVDPATICGGITDANGVAYKQGDTLRGGGFTVVNGKRVWQWTVKVRGKSPSGDHPQVVVHVSYDRPTTSSGGGGGGDGNGGTGSTGSGVCDWSVEFDNPPKTATSVPVGYHLTVRNSGTASCPPTTLKVEHVGGVDTEVALLVAGFPGSYEDPLRVLVPGLGPGSSVSFHVLARPKVADLGTTGNRIRLRASLLPDQDSPSGNDEFARAKTKLKPKPIDVSDGHVDSSGHGTFTVDCPVGKHNHDRCVFKLEIPDTLRPQDRLLITPLASAQGTVAAGHEDDLSFRLREAGRRILDRRHQVMETVIGTRTEDGVSTLVEGHVILKR